MNKAPLDRVILHAVVMKLVGPVSAVGETHEDVRRLANLKELANLVDLLINEIAFAADTASRPEASMKAIGMYAKGFLREIRQP